MTTPPLPEDLVRYLARQDQQRADHVQQTLNALYPIEQRLVREAAVMGYVRGRLAGLGGEKKVPPDSEIVAEVIDACLAMPELCPVISGVAEQRS